MSGVNNVISINLSVTNTPTVSTSAYTAGDQVGGIQTLSNVYSDLFRVINSVQSQPTGSQRFIGHLMLQSITVVDQAAQSADYNLFFFNELPIVASSDNDALDIADTEAGKCVGMISIAPTYVSTGNFSVGSVTDVNLMLPQLEDLSTKDLYVVMSTPDTPTFEATDDLTLRYNFVVH